VAESYSINSGNRKPTIQKFSIAPGFHYH